MAVIAAWYHGLQKWGRLAAVTMESVLATDTGPRYEHVQIILPDNSQVLGEAQIWLSAPEANGWQLVNRFESRGEFFFCLRWSNWAERYKAMVQQHKQDTEDMERRLREAEEEAEHLRSQAEAERRERDKEAA
jgi:hypothetical protein